MVPQQINHMHGDIVRQQWPIGLKIKFRPRGMWDGDPLEGEISGHAYTNVLYIKTDTNEWAVSTQRCIHPTIKNS